MVFSIKMLYFFVIDLLNRFIAIEQIAFYLGELFFTLVFADEKGGDAY